MAGGGCWIEDGLWAIVEEDLDGGLFGYSSSYTLPAQLLIQISRGLNATGQPSVQDTGAAGPSHPHQGRAGAVQSPGPGQGTSVFTGSPVFVNGHAGICLTVSSPAVDLVLKSIADIGLVGYPNAGRTLCLIHPLPPGCGLAFNAHSWGLLEVLAVFFQRQNKRTIPQIMQLGGSGPPFLAVSKIAAHRK